MMDKMYCLTCKRLFDDRMETRRRQSVILWGQFMYNQQRIMWDEPIKFTDNKRVFIVNCPYCMSMDIVNATEIKEIVEQVRTSGLNQYTRHIKKLHDEVLDALKHDNL